MSPLEAVDKLYKATWDLEMSLHKHNELREATLILDSFITSKIKEEKDKKGA